MSSIVIGISHELNQETHNLLAGEPSGISSQPFPEDYPFTPEARELIRKNWTDLTSPRPRDPIEIRIRDFAIREGIGRIQFLLVRARRAADADSRLFTLLEACALVEAMNTVQTRSAAYDPDVSGYPALGAPMDAKIDEARRRFLLIVRETVLAPEDKQIFFRRASYPGEFDGSITEAVARLISLTGNRSTDPSSDRRLRKL